MPRRTIVIGCTRLTLTNKSGDRTYLQINESIPTLIYKRSMASLRRALLTTKGRHFVMLTKKKRVVVGPLKGRKGSKYRVVSLENFAKGYGDRVPKWYEQTGIAVYIDGRIDARSVPRLLNFVRPWEVK